MAASENPLDAKLRKINTAEVTSRPEGMDIAWFPVEEGWFSMAGVSMLKKYRPTAQNAYLSMTYYDSGLRRWVSSSGSATMQFDKTMTIGHEIYTVKGASGAPVMGRGDTVHGVHIAGITNRNCNSFVPFFLSVNRIDGILGTHAQNVIAHAEDGDTVELETHETSNSHVYFAPEYRDHMNAKDAARMKRAGIVIDSDGAVYGNTRGQVPDDDMVGFDGVETRKKNAGRIITGAAGQPIQWGDLADLPSGSDSDSDSEDFESNLTVGVIPPAQQPTNVSPSDSDLDTASSASITPRGEGEPVMETIVISLESGEGVPPDVTELPEIRDAQRAASRRQQDVMNRLTEIAERLQAVEAREEAERDRAEVERLTAARDQALETIREMRQAQSEAAKRQQEVLDAQQIVREERFEAQTLELQQIRTQMQELVAHARLETEKRLALEADLREYKALVDRQKKLIRETTAAREKDMPKYELESTGAPPAVFAAFCETQARLTEAILEQMKQTKQAGIQANEAVNAAKPKKDFQSGSSGGNGSAAQSGKRLKRSNETLQPAATKSRKLKTGSTTRGLPASANASQGATPKSVNPAELNAKDRRLWLKLQVEETSLERLRLSRSPLPGQTPSDRPTASTSEQTKDGDESRLTPPRSEMASSTSSGITPS
jgi:hypothetical protein